MRNDDHRPQVSRRQFLGWGAAAAAAGGATVLGSNVFGARSAAGEPTPAPTPAAPSSAPVPTTEASSTLAPPPTAPVTVPATVAPVVAPVRRRLVVLELSGGNDALNTLVPLAGGYRDARPTLAPAEASLVHLDGLDGYALHPGLSALAPLWQAGTLGFAAGIGWPQGSRSHFEQLALWWRASGESSSAAGWLGRWLDTQQLDDPLTMIGLNGGAPAVVGDTRRATVMRTPASFRIVTPRATDIPTFTAALRVAGPGEAPLVAEARRATSIAVDAVARVQAALPAGAGLDAPSDDGRGEIARGLADASHLLAADPATDVVYVSVGGFDTHANQSVRHDALLADLGSGVAEFRQSLVDAGLADDVLLTVWSEFGRRVAENDSGGTDHGKGGLALLVGTGVAPGVHGALDLGALDDGDLPVTIDARALHAASLTWLGADPAALIGHADTAGLLA